MTDRETSNSFRATAADLRGYVERFEALDSEKREIAEQQKVVMAEAKAMGYDTKALRAIIARRKKKRADLAEFEAIVALYEDALGVLA